MKKLIILFVLIAGCSSPKNGKVIEKYIADRDKCLTAYKLDDNISGTEWIKRKVYYILLDYYLAITFNMPLT